MSKIGASNFSKEIGQQENNTKCSTHTHTHTHIKAVLSRRRRRRRKGREKKVIKTRYILVLVDVVNFL